MRFEGVISKWNDERGFGFIKPDVGDAELFVHISEFPKDGRRLFVGERVSFQVGVDAKGKKRAERIERPDRPAKRVQQRRRNTADAAGDGAGVLWGLVRGVVPLAVLAGIAVFGYGKYVEHERRQDSDSLPMATQQQKVGSSPAFQCDGRTYCSQMTSCEEAKFFLQNCPGTKMDGNNDGIPCEQQWCTGSFFR